MSKMVACALLRAVLYWPSQEIDAHLMPRNKEPFIEKAFYSLFISVHVESP